MLDGWYLADIADRSEPTLSVDAMLSRGALASAGADLLATLGRADVADALVVAVEVGDVVGLAVVGTATKTPPTRTVT